MTAVDHDWSVVNRVVLPHRRDCDTLPLYVEYGERTLNPDFTDPSERRTDPVEPTRDAATHPEDVMGRRSLRIHSGRSASFGTYFNAFPASYWRRWTTVESVRLEVEVDGDATVLVYRSNARGTSMRIEALSTADGPVSIDLPLRSFGDGGWYWFDIVANQPEVVLTNAQWSVAGTPQQTGSLSIGVTTLNRGEFCRELVATVAEAPELRSILDRMYVVDQGSNPVEQTPGWAEVATALGDQLEVIHQDNLGGSGGFSRGMYETLRAGRSAFHVVMDDDIALEPETLLRAHAFARFSKRPTIVGAHMFDLYDRTKLHSFAEGINPARWWWGPMVPDTENHNFATHSLRATPWLHRRIDGEYNGWWTCLIPVSVIREIGLSLPIFLKWDDAEYSVRARRAGYPTVSLPGAAVWHVSWADKDDATDWQSYYHQRNRMLVAMLHSPVPGGGSVLNESFKNSVRHAFAMQYFTNAARHVAIRDLMSGPDHLHAGLKTKLPQVRELMASYDDATFSDDPDVFPLAERVHRSRLGDGAPSVGRLLPWAMATAVRQLGPVDPRTAQRPELSLSHSGGTWWRLAHVDSAVVGKADGTGAAWYRRDPKLFRQQMREAALLHRDLRARWSALAQQYQQALPSLTSVESWERTFGISRTEDQ